MEDSTEIWKPHVTVAAIVEHDGRFLLVRESIDGREMFNQPAGHVEPNETIEQAVIRETMEETSYPFTPKQLCGIYRYIPDPASNLTYLRFSINGIVGDNLNKPLDTGIICTEWMTLDEIKQSQDSHRSPMVLQCVLDYLGKPSYPLQVFSTSFA